MWIRLTTSALVAMLLAGPLAVCGCDDPMEVRTVQHRGFDDAIELTRGDARVVVVPAWAGRMSVLDLGAGNLLLIDPRVEQGKTLGPGQGWMLWDGNATDVADEAGRSQWKQLWLHPWSVETRGPGGVTLASKVNTQAGLSAARWYRLDDRGLIMKYTITSHAPEPRRWTIWERALVPAEDTFVLVPVDAGADSFEAFGGGWKVRDGKRVQPVDRAVGRDGLLVLRGGTEQGVGLAARLTDGWIGIVRDGQVALLRWQIDPEARYVVEQGAHAVFYLAEHAIELEPLSPQFLLQPGKSASFEFLWQKLGRPEGVDPSDPDAVAEWVRRQIGR